MTNDQLIDIWLQGRSRLTVRNYRYYIAKAERLAQEIVGKRLIALGAVELAAVSAKLHANLKPASQCNKIAVLRSFFKFLTAVEERHDDPSTALRPPHCPNTLAERIMTHEEVGRLLVAAADEREQMMIKVLYGAGLRVSELVGLKVKDLRSRVSEKEVMWTLTVLGKGGRTETVRISEDLGKELTAFVKGRPQEAFIFTYAGGVGLYPIHTSAIRRAVRRMGQAIGLPKVSPHWLRHTHASEALRRGANIVLVQRSLRHSNLATTMKYIHLNPDEAASLYLLTL